MEENETLIFNKRWGFFSHLLQHCQVHVHDVSALDRFTVKIWCGTLWNGVTHRPTLHFTHCSCWFCSMNRTHTTYQPYPLSQAVTIVLNTKQIHFYYYRPLSSIRNEGTQVFLLHIYWVLLYPTYVQFYVLNSSLQEFSLSTWLIS
jgi:hypothetical protein